MATTVEARARAVLGVLRAFVTVHAIAILAQSVLAGRYLTGDYDMLALHKLGADMVSAVGVLQLVPAALFWWRAGVCWPFWLSLPLAIGDSVVYLAGREGALDLHVPLGVTLAAIASIMLVGIWRTIGVEQ